MFCAAPGFRALSRGRVTLQQSNEWQHVREGGVAQGRAFCRGGNRQLDRKTLQPTTVPESTGHLGQSPLSLVSPPWTGQTWLPHREKESGHSLTLATPGETLVSQRRQSQK